MVGTAVSCIFTRDDTLGTSLFTQAYCKKNQIPVLGSDWGFVDIVASREKPAGALCVVYAILQFARQKLTGVCAVAVSKSGHRLFKALNFKCYRYKDHGSWRHMCYIRLPQELSFTHIMKHLKFDGNKEIVEDVCWRNALTSRALSSVVGRC